MGAFMSCWVCHLSVCTCAVMSRAAQDKRISLGSRRSSIALVPSEEA